MIKLYVGPTYIAIPTNEKGDVEGSDEFNLGSFIHRHLTLFSYVPRLKRWLIDYRFAYYDAKLKRLRIPLHFLPVLTKELDHLKIEYTSGPIPSYPIRKVDIPLNPNWSDRDDRQTSGIAFLKNTTLPMRALAAQTGCIGRDEQLSLYNTMERCSYKLTIHQLANMDKSYYQHLKLLVKDDHGQFIFWSFDDVFPSGVQEVYELRLVNGKRLKLTATHEVSTDLGYKPLQSLTTDDYVTTVNGLSQVLEIVHIGDMETYDISCVLPYTNFVANGIVVHNSGKTYMAIKTAAILGNATMIVVSGLLPQWRDSILEQTMLLPDDIYMIQGHDTIGKLWSDDYEPCHSFYLASTGTVQRWMSNYNKGPYKNYSTFNKLMFRLGIGTKIIDECHLNFKANVKIDLHSRIANNLYLSATYTRSDKKGKQIFDTTFPAKIKHGENDIKRYAKVFAYKYNFGYVNPEAVKSPMGYSQYKYERYILKRTTKLSHYFDRVIIPLFYSHYINIKQPGQKVIIFCGLLKMCRKLRDKIRPICKEHKLKSIVYSADTSEEELVKNDVIISTTGSLGTGNDVAQLRSVILTNAFDSQGLNKQVLGRLRELKSDQGVPEFAFISNTAVAAHMRYHKARCDLYKLLAAEFYEYDL